jgi:hypothetical protein
VIVIEITNILFGLNAEHLNVTAAHKCTPQGVLIFIVGHVGTVMMAVVKICDIRTPLMKRPSK